VTHRYVKQCVNNIIEVTRRTRITLSTQISNPPRPVKCHVIRFDRVDTLSTGEECHEYDFIDQSDAESVWAAAAKARWAARPAPGGSQTPRITPGTEKTAAEPFRSGAMKLRQERNEVLDQEGPGRTLYLETSNGEEIVTPADFVEDDTALGVQVHPDGGRFMLRFALFDVDMDGSLAKAPAALAHFFKSKS